MLWSDESSATEAGQVVRWEGKATPRYWTCQQTGWTNQQRLQGGVNSSFFRKELQYSQAKQDLYAFIIIVRAYSTRPSVYGI